MGSVAIDANRLKCVRERLKKVVYLTPSAEQANAIRILVEDARWLLGELDVALLELTKLPEDAA